MINRYKQTLQSIPAPGCGCHVSLLGAANIGIIAGIDPSQIISDIRQAIPDGARRIPDREICAAVKKAVSDHRPSITLPSGETYHRYTISKLPPVVKDGKAALQRIIKQAFISNEVDLWEASPRRLWNNPENDPGLFLSTMFESDDLLFIGERDEPGVLGKNIKPMSDWITAHHRGEQLGPFIIVNPLPGLPGEKKDGSGLSLRCDDCVIKFKYTLGEFDNISKEDQIRFWTAVKLPVRALVDTGGKSIHAWIDVQELAKVETTNDWNREIRGRLYEQGLMILGVDSSCKNETRLSRMPGFLRDTGRFQKLLWLKGRDEND